MFDLPRVGREGNGFYTASLKVAPSVYILVERWWRIPVDRIANVIDGRTQIVAHGSRDMPIW